MFKGVYFMEEKYAPLNFLKNRNDFLEVEGLGTWNFKL
jgi:hypothetical protein